MEKLNLLLDPTQFAVVFAATLGDDAAAQSRQNIRHGAEQLDRHAVPEAQDPEQPCVNRG